MPCCISGEKNKRMKTELYLASFNSQSTLYPFKGIIYIEQILPDIGSPVGV